MRATSGNVRTLCVAMMIVLISGQARAWDEPRKTEAALYSNLCHSAKGGQQGERLLLINSYTTFHVVYQEANIYLAPAIGIAKIFDDKIAFQVQSQSGEIRSFAGTVSPDSITGRFVGGAEIRWDRISADRRTQPACPVR